jgi:nucleoid-associated protein YgaU
MNRRDTILAAVLLNVGLLVVLFVGALKPDPLVEKPKVSLASEPRQEVVAVSVDPVDHLLKNYAQEAKKEAELIEVVKPVIVRQDSPKVLENKAVDHKAVEEGKYYIVKSGDNPWSIAIKNHIKFDELLRLNHLDEDKAKKLKPGDKLRIK